MKLIILYGGGSDQHPLSEKTKSLLRGEMTCGYREYAQTMGGVIVYMTNERKKSRSNDLFFNSRSDMIEYCNSNKEAIVWSVKSDPSKNHILKRITNFKMHYPCQGRNMVDKYCHINLVDSSSRLVQDNCKVFFKGKNCDFWKPNNKTKEFDYVIMGRKDNKNQSYFIDRLNSIKDKRSVLWIGGDRYRDKVRSRHRVEYTSVLSPSEVRRNICRARVGVLCSDIKTEGFPQSFLEMTMCGVPVAYKGTLNHYYFDRVNCELVSNRKKIVSSSELLLLRANSSDCRKFAMETYSIKKSIDQFFKFKEEYYRY